MSHVWFGLVQQERKYMDELWAWQRFCRWIWTIQNFGVSRQYNGILTNIIFCIVISESTTIFEWLICILWFNCLILNALKGAFASFITVSSIHTVMSGFGLYIDLWLYQTFLFQQVSLLIRETLLCICWMELWYLSASCLFYCLSQCTETEANQKVFGMEYIWLTVHVICEVLNK